MRRGLLGVVTVAAGVALGSPGAAAPAPRTPAAIHESTHYRLEVNGNIGEPSDYLKMAEALYTQLTAYCGATPPTRKRLEIRFWDNKADYLAGGQADGLTAGELDAGGYYAPKTQRAYFWKQPNLYATRHLFLHELTHQFHYLSVLGGSQRVGQGWYLEGFAEEFAYHRWDGTTLQTGLSDIVCLEKRIVNVRERARAGTFDLVAIIEGRGTFDRGDFWGVVHYLRHGAPPAVQRQWQVLERKLWKGAGNGVIARELLAGRRGAQLAAAARDWVAEVPHTWRIEWVNWDMDGDALRGWSKTQALLTTQVTYPDATFIAATVQPGPGRVLLGVGQSTGVDLTGLALEPDGRVHYAGRVSGGATQVDATQPVALRVERLADGRVQGTVNGTALDPATPSTPLGPGRCALVVGAGDRRFTDWAVAPPPPR